jgi:large subunit ribosomal protein L25
VKEFTVNIQKRNEMGSSAMRRFRNAGLIPSVLYGRGQDSVSALLPARDFLQLAQQARISQVWRFKSEDKDLNDRMAIVKEVQQEFVSGKVTHVDFQVLHENEEIHVEIPLRVVGEAPGVKVENGILSVSAHELAVMCLPKAIPQLIEIDISSLALGQSIHAKDIALPAGVRLYGDPEETIVSVVTVRQTKLAEEEGAQAAAEGAAAPAEGAAAAPAAGAAAPAKGGKEK